MQKVLVIVGPTASGKSALAVELARQYNGEVISADSRQVYRGLNLASGKVPISHEPPRGEYAKSSIPSAWRARGIPMYKGIPHHLIDVASPRRVFTVTDYKHLAERAIKDVAKRGKLPIIAGGTGHYIDAVLYDQKIPDVKPDPKLRAKLEKLSAPELFSKLKELDPKRATGIERHNPRRLIRAIEIILATGKPIPPLAPKRAAYDAVKIGIYPGAGILRKKIAARLRARLRQGMVAEVRRLHENGVPWKRLEDMGLEARWIARYLQDKVSKEEMARALERDIWQYSRRQMTWWRKDKEIRWLKKPSPATRLKFFG